MNITEAIVIIDKSGSMEPLAADTIGGYNAFIKSQQEPDDPCFLTTYVFSSSPEVRHFHVPVREAPLFTADDYRCGGGTALHDALGTAINEVSERLNASLEEKPANVVFLIITDGQENSSRKYNLQQIKDLIAEKQDKEKWNFVYIGANVDQFEESDALGFATLGKGLGSRGIGYEASKHGLASMYCSLGETMTEYRTSGVFDTRAMSGEEVDKAEKIEEKKA